MLSRILGTRWIYAAIAFGCITLLAMGYYIQFVEHIEPCPMCIFQRLCYFAVIAVGLVATLHGPRGGWHGLYCGLLFLAAATGAGIAGRQTWLQHLPADKVPECGPGLNFMLEMYPLAEVIKKALKGTGDCAKVDWTLLGFSIAEWSLLCFSMILVVAGLQLRAALRGDRG
ncbi:MAG: disulfide bond formation protein B [Gammaproteobacteria bacterium]|nr:disulfide bond formation protein B [Gammaproteobacteria bacterium]MBI5617655.1 disulfide bond formation protein B [Gammaproteobacteria bacterium]